MASMCSSLSCFMLPLSQRNTNHITGTVAVIASASRQSK